MRDSAKDALRTVTLLQGIGFTRYAPANGAVYPDTDFGRGLRALAAIITLTAGSSGTLMTPMAANFNIVPAALLNLKDQYGVIRFQLPYALTLWAFHVVLLWLLIKLL